MINNNNTKIDIQPILNDVNNVVKNGLNKLIYDISFLHLTNELNKCKEEMEFYKKELKLIKQTYKNNNENILLKIEDYTNLCSDEEDNNISEIKYEKIINNVDINNVQIKEEFEEKVIIKCIK